MNTSCIEAYIFYHTFDKPESKVRDPKKVPGDFGCIQTFKMLDLSLSTTSSFFFGFYFFSSFSSVSGVAHLLTLLILFPGFLTLVVVTSLRQVSGLGLPCSLW